MLGTSYLVLVKQQSVKQNEKFNLKNTHKYKEVSHWTGVAYAIKCICSSTHEAEGHGTEVVVEFVKT